MKILLADDHAVVRHGLRQILAEDFKKANFAVVDASFERTADLQYADINLKIAFNNKHQYFNFERQLEGDSRFQFLATREL